MTMEILACAITYLSIPEKRNTYCFRFSFPLPFSFVSERMAMSMFRSKSSFVTSGCFVRIPCTFHTPIFIVHFCRWVCLPIIPSVFQGLLLDFFSYAFFTSVNELILRFNPPNLEGRDFFVSVSSFSKKVSVFRRQNFAFTLFRLLRDLHPFYATHCPEITRWAWK